jgi:hypothetical protein
MKPTLIDDDDEIYNIVFEYEENMPNNINTEKVDTESSENDDPNNMYLVYNENVDSDDPIISDFLKFCMREGLFDNTFYDMNNTFSVVATKLPKTFEKLSKNGTNVKKRTFIQKFKKEFGYPGDINFIYNCLDINKQGFITWDDFMDFFLPFVQYVTV